MEIQKNVLIVEGIHIFIELTYRTCLADIPYNTF